MKRIIHLVGCFKVGQIMDCLNGSMGVALRRRFLVCGAKHAA